jgi:hypothetical protein
VIHERDVAGPARQRLDPDRARTGAQVEEARADDARLDELEDDLARAPRGGPHPLGGRALQRPPAKQTVKHPHLFFRQPRFHFRLR